MGAASLNVFIGAADVHKSMGDAALSRRGARDAACVRRARGRAVPLTPGAAPAPPLSLSPPAPLSCVPLLFFSSENTPGTRRFEAGKIPHLGCAAVFRRLQFPIISLFGSFTRGMDHDGLSRWIQGPGTGGATIQRWVQGPGTGGATIQRRVQDPGWTQWHVDTGSSKMWTPDLVGFSRIWSWI